ncbi:MAG: alanine/glycine:cation symporter family protein [Actinomycetaceae bacterium]|nr:alanine/glycine:cation symporter family protein [Actinomycetaceae bacterium]MDY6082472.1 alanine/glycine:cation symporter family protein [Actinomycetaceae bacterium]
MASFFGAISDWVYTYILIALLIAAGIYFTVRTGAVQIRNFGNMVHDMFSSREHTMHGGISSFQAFTVGLASRIGTGNIAGVAIAILTGGPGAVFWMWVIALLGMSTAFVEATLAQLFKIHWPDGTFRGGPAFYIERGLHSRAMGIVFAICLLFSFGLSYEMVQANTISGTLHDAWNVPTWATAVLLVVITAPIVFGGLKRVARITEIMAPMMAVVYMLVAIVIIVMNVGNIGHVLSVIFQSAFGLRQGLGGVSGGLAAALLNGARRGLFSNEAGEGSAPNAASTAHTTHPARQGLIQSFGVFVDTILVSSATAFIILNAAPDVYSLDSGSTLDGAALTTAAAASQLGGWITPLMIVMIFVFAYSSILGNYSYAEVNVDFLTHGSAAGPYVLRSVIVIATAVGSVAPLQAVWNFADITMAAQAIINLIAIVLLGKWAFGALNDYRAHPHTPFVATNNPYMPGDLPTDVWVEAQDEPRHV